IVLCYLWVRLTPKRKPLVPRRRCDSSEPWTLDRGAHARCIHEFFRVMIDFPSASSAARMIVKLVSLNRGGRWRREIDFVSYRLLMIGKLQVGAIDAVKFPNHSQEICLSPK